MIKIESVQLKFSKNDFIIKRSYVFILSLFFKFFAFSFNSGIQDELRN